jgi:cysteine synthase A
MKYDNILQTIGRTPEVRINRLYGPTAQVWIKCERANPGGSLKDRIALAMVEVAERAVRSSPAAPSSSPPAATPAWAWPWWPPSRATRSCW